MACCGLMRIKVRPIRRREQAREMEEDKRKRNPLRTFGPTPRDDRPNSASDCRHSLERRGSKKKKKRGNMRQSAGWVSVFFQSNEWTVPDKDWRMSDTVCRSSNLWGFSLDKQSTWSGRI